MPLVIDTSSGQSIEVPGTVKQALTATFLQNVTHRNNPAAVTWDLVNAKVPEFEKAGDMNFALEVVPGEDGHPRYFRRLWRFLAEESLTPNDGN